MATIPEPVLPFEAIAVGLAGIDYGEFDLASLPAEAAPFKAAMFSVAKGGQTPRDIHAVRECWYIVAGRGTLVYDGGEYTIEPRQLLFFESHRPHAVRNTGDAELTVLSLWWPPPGGHASPPA